MRPARKVIVTGGAGFIGSHVVERLVGLGVEVVVLDDLSRGLASNLPAGVQLLEIDLATPDAVSAIVDARPDSVVHCAAQVSVPASFDDPIRDAQSNIVGSLSVIKGCIAAGVTSLVYVTTGGALYGRPMVVPWDEQATISPISPYGVSKSVVEAYLEVLVPAPDTTVLRLANVYGPRQGSVGESGVVATFIDHMRKGHGVVIYGDGEQTRDLLYVADAVDVIETALASDTNGTFNIGTGTGVSVNTLFEMLASLMGYEQPPSYATERIGDVRHSVLDPALAARLLGWKARTPLADGLRKTVTALSS
jgi:UDP-glucose 4-epimerase